MSFSNENLVERKERRKERRKEGMKKRKKERRKEGRKEIKENKERIFPGFTKYIIKVLGQII